MDVHTGLAEFVVYSMETPHRGTYTSTEFQVIGTAPPGANPVPGEGPVTVVAGLAAQSSHSRIRCKTISRSASPPSKKFWAMYTTREFASCCARMAAWAVPPP